MSKKLMSQAALKNTVAEFYSLPNALNRAAHANHPMDEDLKTIAKAVIADQVLANIVSYWPMLTPDVKAVIVELLPRECVE